MLALRNTGPPGAPRETGHCLWLSLGWGWIMSPWQAGSITMTEADMAAGPGAKAELLSLRHRLPWGQMVLSRGSPGSTGPCSAAQHPPQLKVSWPLPGSRCWPVPGPWPMLGTLSMVMETGWAQWAPRTWTGKSLGRGGFPMH